MYPVRLGKQDNQICSVLLWNTRGSYSQREIRPGNAGVSCRHRDGRDAEPVSEALRRKPTRELRSSAPDRTIYGSRCRDLIGQPECRLEVLNSWEPHACSLARNSNRRVVVSNITNALGNNKLISFSIFILNLLFTLLQLLFT